MKSGSYTLHELFAGRDIEQLLVPEIQRDYVWGPEQIKLLLEDLRQAAHSWEIDAALPLVPGIDAEVYQSFREYYARQVHGHGIGFIYAYQDVAYPGKALLIDGQQRLTTLYLLLLALAMRSGKDSEPCQHFKNFYLWQGRAKIDYRVREAAHAFLQRFIDFVLKGGQPQFVKQQYWYFAEYDDDLTIRNVAVNYTFLVDKLALPDYHSLSYQYLRDFVQFQYFDTNLSTQGEELYLSLNSTGHPTENNENVRALLLEREEAQDRQQWGVKWEGWQDFFWKHRGHNHNADNGFDEFLRWLWIIRLIENGKSGVADQLAENKLGVWELAEDAAVRMVDVERLFEVVVHISEELPEASLFFGVEWLKAGGTTRARLSQGDAFRLLPVLRYCLSRPVGTRPSVPMLYRLARYFYNISRTGSVVAKNTSTYLLPAIRLAANLAATSEDIIFLLDLPIASATHDRAIIPAEELWKLRQYRNPPANASREQLENLVWALEDDDWNQGEISHLFSEVNLTALSPVALAMERLTDVSQAYFQLFPATNADSVARNKNQRLLQSVLLNYGPYWQEVSPWYYVNCAFNRWHSTVRKTEFQTFFAEFVTASVSLDTFYHEQKQNFFAGRTVEQLRGTRVVREQLFILAALFYQLDPQHGLSAGIWRCGHRIGYKSKDEDQNSYPFFTEDICFVNAQTYPYKDSSVMTVVDALAQASGADPYTGVEALVSKLLLTL